MHKMLYEASLSDTGYFDTPKNVIIRAWQCKQHCKALIELNNKCRNHGIAKYFYGKFPVAVWQKFPNPEMNIQKFR